MTRGKTTMAKTDQKRIADILADPRCKKMERTLTVDRACVDMEKRTVELSFASEAPVDRWFGREILGISEDECDMSRLRNGGAMLVNHNPDDHVGVVMNTTVDMAAKKCRCTVKLSQSARGQDILNDINDGIRTLTSVHYAVRKMVLQSVDGGVETHRVTDWMPYEVSLVAIPADASVGVGRSQTQDDQPAHPAPATTTRSTITSMAEATPTAPAVNESEIRTTATTAERQRIKEVNATAAALTQRHPQHAEKFRALALKCAETGDGVDVFNASVLKDILATSPAAPATRQDPDAATIGMSAKEKRQYSLMRAIQRSISHQPLDGIEREANDELTKKLGREPTGFFMPDDVLADRRAQRRTYTVGVPSGGGYTVAENLLASELETYLRNNAVVAKLGARTISGLVGDVTIPRQLTGATAYWVTETGTITASNGTFGQILGKPRRIGTSVPYSKQFVAQTSLDAESFVIDDSEKATAVELDRVALRGIGGSEPLGVAYLATADRSTSVTFSAAPTWAKYLEFMSSIAANNALANGSAYVASVAAAVKAATVAKFSNTSDPIWNLDAGKVGPFRAEWTTQLLTSSTPVANMVIFGDWSQVIYLEWAGRDVVTDIYGTNATGGTVTVTIQRLIDCVIRRGKSFAQSADSGAQ